MHYRTLGRSGLKVSNLVLGTMTIGGGGAFAKVGDQDAAMGARLIDMALEAGVNMLDTADIYSAGICEERLGEAIKGRRNRLLLASKVRFPTGDKGPNDRGLSRHHIIEACEASLRRLGTDYLDLYWCHSWDGQTPLDETLRAFDDLVGAGKIRYLGVSNFSAWHIMKMLAAAERESRIRPVAQQIHYTLEAREAEHELLPVAVDQGIEAVIWSPIAGGLLTGKYRRGKPQPEGTRHAAEWNEPPVTDLERLYDIVEVLVEVADGLPGASPVQVGLAWLLAQPGVNSLIVGARTEAQLAETLKAADLTLPQEALDRLEAVSRRPLPYPLWHQMRTAADRPSPADLVAYGAHLKDGS
ncbi:MAG: aldo/keto reductase [Rhodobacteraceae bacterium]|nr:aldo/keto reductase [Paracoccaceae bacterium]